MVVHCMAVTSGMMSINETRGMALFILVAKSALHFPRVPRWVHLASEAPSDNSQ